MVLDRHLDEVGTRTLEGHVLDLTTKRSKKLCLYFNRICLLVSILINYNVIARQLFIHQECPFSKKKKNLSSSWLYSVRALTLVFYSGFLTHDLIIFVFFFTFLAKIRFLYIRNGSN